MIELAEHPTPLGDVRIATYDGELVALAFLDSWRCVEANLTRHLPAQDCIDAAVPHEFTRCLDACLAGELRALDRLRVRAGGTDFQRRAWAATRQVAPGWQRTYGELAGDAGAGHALRAVSAACGANPVLVVIPCHRIVRAAGDLSGYAGGVERREWLLEHERRHTSPPAASVKRR